MCLVCTEYIQYVLELPNSFWRYNVFTFDNGKGYCVYGTGTWWCLKTRTVPDFVAIIQVIVPVHTEYIPCTVFSITYRYVLGTDRYIPVCTKNYDFVQPVTIPDVILDLLILLSKWVCARRAAFLRTFRDGIGEF